MRAIAGSPGSAAVAWHDCECGGYRADLDLWRSLAARAGGQVLELGAGTGRVALDLARAGFEVTAVERERKLVRELERRARAEGLAVEPVLADCRDLALGGRFGLVAAPMQLAQLLGGPDGRAAMLRSAAAHLEPGGAVAVALLADPGPSLDAGRPPLPDVLERDGWVYSSMPLEVRGVDRALEVRRLRQLVAPSGGLGEEVDITRLDTIDALGLESEARAAGLRPAGRREIPPTDEHVGSTVVLLEGG